MLTLYHCAGSRGLRALWTIEEMGLECDLQTMPFPPRMTTPSYLDINPLGTVPMLVDGDSVMTESSGISFYLASRYGPTDLILAPGDADYPEFLDFIHYADATLTFPQTVYLRYTMMEKKRGLEEAGELYADWFAARLVKLERRLSDRSFLCSERFTIADIAVGYGLILANVIGLGERLSPVIQSYHVALTARPAFLEARRRESVVASSQEQLSV